MQQTKNEFSRPVEISRIPTTGMKEELEASERERAALAERLGLVSVDFLNASVRLKAVGRDRVRVKGDFHAGVTQTCVVSLEPFKEEIKDSFRVLFVSDLAEESLRPNEIDLDANESEETDVAENGKIDVGELVVQYLALALDPFPKRPDVEFLEVSTTQEDDKVPENPFSILEKLKKS